MGLIQEKKKCEILQPLPYMQINSLLLLWERKGNWIYDQGKPYDLTLEQPGLGNNELAEVQSVETQSDQGPCLTAVSPVYTEPPLLLAFVSYFTMQKLVLHIG